MRSEIGKREWGIGIMGGGGRGCLRGDGKGIGRRRGWGKR